MRGKFITFEGCDGVGKSTQIAMLKQHLELSGVDVLLVREPGGNQISEKIRNIILDKYNDEMTDKCELLLYFASRAQLIAQVIEPALSKGTTVICDRYVDSTIAYQGHARGIGVEYIARLIELICADTMPDATVFIDVKPENAFRRYNADKSDRIELEGLAFQNLVYDGFIIASQLYPHRFIAVQPDAVKSVTNGKIIDALSAKGVI